MLREIYISCRHRIFSGYYLDSMTMVDSPQKTSEKIMDINNGGKFSDFLEDIRLCNWQEDKYVPESI